METTSWRKKVSTFTVAGVKITDQQRMNESEEYFKHGLNIIHTYEDDVSIVGTILSSLDDVGVTEIDIEYINDLVKKTRDRFESLGVDPDNVRVYSFHHVD